MCFPAERGSRHQQDVEPADRFVESEVGDDPHSVRSAQELARGADQHHFVTVLWCDEFVGLGKHVGGARDIECLHAPRDCDSNPLHGHVRLP